MSEKCTETIEINLPSVELAKTIYHSLKPESNARCKITIKDGTLILDFKAKTTATLRALTNSYLRWIILVQQVYSQVTLNTDAN